MTKETKAEEKVEEKVEHTNYRDIAQFFDEWGISAVQFPYEILDKPSRIDEEEQYPYVYGDLTLDPTSGKATEIRLGEMPTTKKMYKLRLAEIKYMRKMRQ